VTWLTSTSDGPTLTAMQNQAATVDAYLSELQEDRRGWLTEVRADCLALLTGCTETMRYGMPGCRRDGGEGEVGLASQKVTGLGVGKGCIRYRRRVQMDRSLLRSMLAATAATRGPIC